jgi:hypothetical protein
MNEQVINADRFGTLTRDNAHSLFEAISVVIERGDTVLLDYENCRYFSGGYFSEIINSIALKKEFHWKVKARNLSNVGRYTVKAVIELALELFTDDALANLALDQQEIYRSLKTYYTALSKQFPHLTE